MPEQSNVRPLRTIEGTLDGPLRDLLVAMRNILWDALNDERTQPRDLSPLTLRLRELDAEIRAIDDAEIQQQSASVVVDRVFDPSTI